MKISVYWILKKWWLGFLTLLPMFLLANISHPLLFFISYSYLLYLFCTSSSLLLPLFFTSSTRLHLFFTYYSHFLHHFFTSSAPLLYLSIHCFFISYSPPLHLFSPFVFTRRIVSEKSCSENIFPSFTLFLLLDFRYH